MDTDVHTHAHAESTPINHLLLQKGELKITQITDVHPSSISVKLTLLQCLQGYILKCEKLTDAK